MELQRIAVGIDFGTSNSAVADVSITGQPQPIQPEGARSKVLPSVVFLGPEGPVVGEAALAERQQIVERYTRYAPAYNMRARQALREFLEG